MNKLILMAVLFFVGCATSPRSNFANRQIASANIAIQNYLDSQLAAMKFNPSVQGDLKADVLIGQAKDEYQIWSKSGVAPSIYSVPFNGTMYWAFSSTRPLSELGGDEIPYIAVFLASDGSIQATGDLPSSQGLKGFIWDANPQVGDTPQPAPFVPVMKPATASQNANFVIKQILGEFDEVALANKTYNGNDPDGNRLQMKALSTAGNLSFTILKQGTQVDSFALKATSRINETNLDQYNQDTEGSYFVVSIGTPATTFWIHDFEGTTAIKIQHGGKITEFDFDSDR